VSASIHTTPFSCLSTTCSEKYKTTKFVWYKQVMASEELTEINRQINLLYAKKCELEGAEYRLVTEPKVKNWIGKTFVYRNNSCGGEAKWDVFRKALDVVFGEYLAWTIFEELEINGDGMAAIRIATDLVSRGGRSFMEDRWEACGIEEYAAMRQRVMDQLANPTLARECLEGRK
jgi:hypothetical protein